MKTKFCADLTKELPKFSKTKHQHFKNKTSSAQKTNITGSKTKHQQLKKQTSSALKTNKKKTPNKCRPNISILKRFQILPNFSGHFKSFLLLACGLAVCAPAGALPALRGGLAVHPRGELVVAYAWGASPPRHPVFLPTQKGGLKRGGNMCPPFFSML